MTDFEQQVAEALATAFPDTTEYAARTMALRVAPRIAAAIDASAERFVAAHAEEWGHEESTLLNEARELALAVLRGTSGETP